MALWASDGGRPLGLLQVALAVGAVAAACGSKMPGATANDGAVGGQGGNAGGGSGGASSDARDAAADDARPDVSTTADAAADLGGGDTSDGGGPYPEAPGLCRAGWCWSNPLLQGNFIRSMCGHSLSDVWAVGDGATILHWDGMQWSSLRVVLPFDTYHNFANVWCSPGGSVWIGGRYALLRVRNGVLTDLTPAGSNIYQFLSAGGVAEDDVWIGASDEIAFHWDGTQLTQMFQGNPNPPGGNAGLYGVLARARDDVWFAGTDTTYHYDGVTITEQPLTPTISGPRHFWWVPGDSLLADDDDGFYRWSEQASVWEKAPFTLRGGTAGLFMFGLSSSDLWAVDAYGSGLIHWDGAAWFFSPQSPNRWTSGYVAPSGELIVGGTYGRLGRVPATPARVQDRVLETTGRGWDLGTDFTAIWASADGTAVHAVPGPYWLTPNGWERAPTTGTVGTGLNGIWGSSANDVWAVGSYGEVAHFDGHTWSTVATSLPGMETSTLYAISGTGPADVWAVGRNGMTGHYDGSSWKFGPVASLSDLYAVHAASPDDVWAVGKNGARQHYTLAGGWKLEPQYTSLELRGVFSAGPNDVWVAADSGYVLHWNGTAWSSTVISNSGPPKFMAMSGRAANDIWVAGWYGTLLHWNGTSWSDGGSPTGYDLNGLWVGPAGDAWLAGDNSVIVRRH